MQQVTASLGAAKEFNADAAAFAAWRQACQKYMLTHRLSSVGNVVTALW